jgi:uncharacterized membrane protein
MTLAALTFSGRDWIWAALLGAAVLLPLAWWALRPASPQRGAIAVGLGLRTFGIGLLLLSLLDPQWTSLRAKRGANLLAMIADNSQGLQITDAGAAQTRGEMLRTLIEPGNTWMTALADEYQVRRYTFDRDLRRVTDFRSLDFRGERTDLGVALRQVRERFVNQPLAGIVLFTDGNATDLPNGVVDTAGLPPIFPVVLGRAEGVADVRLERIELRQTAFDDAPVTLRVGVAGEGNVDGGATVSVRPLARTGVGDPGYKQLTQREAGVADSGQRSAALEQRVRLRRAATPTHTEFQWRPAGTGVQFHEVNVTSENPAAEATLLNNRRIVLTDRGRPEYRILYVGGRLNWEFKFLNRALADDPQLKLVALLRLAHREPKFEFKGRAGEASNPLFRGFGTPDETTRYDQPVLTRINTRDAAELRGGFPRTAEELFSYDALVLDDIEAGFFSPDQLLLVRRFVAERGGGLLMLGGVNSLEHGGYRETSLAAALPVYLDRLATSVPQGAMTWRLTREGWLQPWTRIRALETDERARLEQMPRFLVANALAAVKPGATVLATLEDETGETYPALVAQPFGSGRVASVGVGDLWRWGLRGANEQADLARFWRQLSRWLVTDVPAPVELRVVSAIGQPGMELRVTAREPDYRPLESARVRVTVQRTEGVPGRDGEGSRLASPASARDALAATDPGERPEGFQQAVLTAEPASESPGRYTAAFAARDAGAYLATAEVHDRAGRLIGRAEAGWVHDPAADEFQSLVPNRALLEELARRTGGAIIEPSDLGQIVKRLSSAPAPIMETTSRPLWHNGWVFLAVLGCFLGEWAWRRWRRLA